ncbi:FMN oxidoreductase [Siccirubricoccus deserti]|uniref:NADH:flavin oxidoreductase/NADH oxidase n=1 Tax=Siccirubricoccus deserti TaxID=2013562 RepID=A0A9X0UBN8_9PROT|nr:NADH:flavin oxidoreductase/NADH oxidase [Siccirubricoccus deserti]MBC4014232.1 NADH:flavin oxidoreductase/NADH oxidase [Siccirubricoccus deserti]GGC27598.1 FMN oxidoreductase [Siccirubricoccus deserti]
MTDLFEPLTLRGVTLKNRIGVSPMCQYCSADDGKATEWHYAHLVSRAIGGAGLTMTEAAAVAPEGRISHGDLGIWEDAQLAGHKRLVAGITAAGSVPAIQIAHAGRKASRMAPWADGPAQPGWQAIAPSAAAFGDFAVPHALSEAEIAQAIADFAAAAKRSVAAGYRFIELHAAHGYLVHQFLSPLSNRRNDAWGGDFDGRTRFAEAVTKAVRAAIPDEIPLCVRLSHTDWVEGGWTTEETVRLSARLKALGVDMVDVSSGGLDHRQKIPLGPGYQVPGAEAVRRGAGVAVAAVGLITEPAQAQAILTEGKADLILLGRLLLRDPYWPLHAAAALGRTEALKVPPQYERGWNTLGRMTRDPAIAAPLPPL